jgi:DNA-binding CsgD family transcriptional regulator
LIQGLANKEIGKTLGVSVRTVETHLKNLRLKTGLPNRTALAESCE